MIDSDDNHFNNHDDFLFHYLGPLNNILNESVTSTTVRILILLLVFHFNINFFIISINKRMTK